MAQLGPITVTVSVSLGTTELPVKPITFEVPLRTTELTTDGSGYATGTIDLDRTELREQLTKSVRTLADQVEGAFLTPGSVLLTCDQCDAQIVTETLATLRHETDGAHTLVTPAVSVRTRFAGNESLRAESAIVGETVTPAASTTPDDEQTHPTE